MYFQFKNFSNHAKIWGELPTLEGAMLMSNEIWGELSTLEIVMLMRNARLAIQQNWLA
jgi:hypothetical protein